MPPKVKVMRDEIIETTLDMIRKEGEEGINARSIAAVIGCSTQPIFSNFSSMEELLDETKKAAYGIYFSTIEKELNEGKYPPYKSFGMAYIRFANEEKQLFKWLFMCDRSDGELAHSEDFDASVELIKNANGISREKAQLIHLEMWSFVHGIATMLATSFLKLEWELISDMLTDVYLGIRTRHLTGDNANGSN